MNRMLAGSLMLLAAAAASGECIKTGTVCVEAGGTRWVDGIPVTRDCWSERDAYVCLSDAPPAEDGCAAFASAGADADCRRTEASCADAVESADGVNVCLTESERWTCSKKIELPALNAGWEGDGPVDFEDEAEAAECAAWASDGTCRRGTKTCVDGTCTVTYDCEAVKADACSKLEAAGCRMDAAPACPEGAGDCALKTGVATCEGEEPTGEGVEVEADVVTNVGQPALSTEACPAASSASCRQTSSRCVDPGGVRTINGKVYYQRCWGYDRTYECDVPAASTCGGLEAAGCALTGEVCARRDDSGNCLVTTRHYRCAGSDSIPGGEFEGVEPKPEGEVTVSDCGEAAGDPSCTLVRTACLESDAADPARCLVTEFQYRCAGESTMTDECAALAANPRCREEEGVCLALNASGECTFTTKRFVCEASSTETAVGESCGASLCIGDVCRPAADAESSGDFLESAGVLEIMRQAAVYGDVGDGALFAGTASGCSVKAAGFSCCRPENAETTSGLSNTLFSVMLTTGIEAAWEGVKYAGSPYVYDLLGAGGDETSWLLTKLYGEAGTGVYHPSLSLYGVSASMSGGSLSLTFSPASFLFSMAGQMAAEYFSCTAEDQLHAMRRSQNLCRYVGSWCRKKGGGACLEKRESWCCFNSRLALIVQSEGRRQLGLGWGTPEAPACRGLTIEEFQQLDFSKMDLTPVIAELAATAKKTVSADAVKVRAEERVSAVSASPDRQYVELKPFDRRCGAGVMGTGCVGAESLVLTGEAP